MPTNTSLIFRYAALVNWSSWYTAYSDGLVAYKECGCVDVRGVIHLELRYTALRLDIVETSRTFLDFLQT